MIENRPKRITGNVDPYSQVCIAMSTACRNSEELKKISVALHQTCTLNPSLFALLIDVLIENMGTPLRRRPRYEC